MNSGIKKIKCDVILLWQFAIEDFRSKYAGSLLGMVWAFIQPIITILIYWFIFQIGFRSTPVEDYPFILWLTAGLTGWFFISDAIASATSSLMEYSYLVKKVLFNINILPVIRICSTLLVQFFILAFTIVLFAAYGYYPDIYYLQLLYYMMYMMVLTTGIVYLTSALYVFFKDILQIVSIVIQLLFWLTPIVWSIDIMPENIQSMLKWNPLYYITLGYRNCLIYKRWFWEDWQSMLFFWGMAGLILLVGYRVFNSFKSHFADVL